MEKALYFSGLNGLRAIAAIAVLFSHTTMSFHSFGLDSFIYGKNVDGNPKTTLLSGFGVSLFFTLSGFLITYLLLEEKKIKEINIKHFYFRRALRIWPLYYLYFVACIVTMIIFEIPFLNSSVLFYAFMLPNIPFIFGGMIGPISHFWSIGVEEQFYLFWPWIIKKSNNVLKITITICISLIILKITVRYIDILFHQGEMSWLYNLLHVIRFQCMLIGAIGGILYFQKNQLFLKIIDNLIVQSLSWLIIVLVAINKFHLISVIDNEFISVITVFIIIGQININNRIVNLDIAFFNFTGKISYGIYVIHPIIIFYISKIIHFTDKTNIYNYVLVYCLVFFTTILLSYLSYEYFEKRFLSLKLKFTTINSTNSKE